MLNAHPNTQLTHEASFSLDPRGDSLAADGRAWFDRYARSFSFAFLGVARSEVTDQLDLRYEDLVAEPLMAIAPVYSMLGLQPLTSMPRDGHVGTLDEPAEFMQWKRKLSKPVDAASVGRFGKDLSSEQIDAIGSEAGDMMQRFGYGPSAQA